MNINQAPEDKISYQFIVGNLNGNTISSVTAMASNLILSNVSTDGSSVFITVDSTGVSGSGQVMLDLNISNGDLINRCLKFQITKICF